MRRSTDTLLAAAAALWVACSPSAAQQQIGAPAEGPWWIEVGVKAHSILVDPTTLEAHEIIEADQPPMGILSPDGSKVAFLGTQPGSAQAYDLFVADVDLTQPSGKSNIRRLTTDQERPIDFEWMPSSDALVFLAGSVPVTDVWYVEIAQGHQPRRLSVAPRRCHDISVSYGGRIFYLVTKVSQGHEESTQDLMMVCSPPRHAGSMPDPGAILEDQDVFSYAISPDDKTLAWSGAGLLHLVDLNTGTSREIPLQEVHAQLRDHAAYHIAWRPDGKVLAIYCGYLGAILRSADAFPSAQLWRSEFARDKLFFVPVDWTPSADQPPVGEGEALQSPMAEDPNAEVSPPAGDESRPWWVRGLSQRPLTMKWISADEGKRRVEATDR